MVVGHDVRTKIQDYHFPDELKSTSNTNEIVGGSEYMAKISGDYRICSSKHRGAYWFEGGVYLKVGHEKIIYGNMIVLVQYYTN